MQSTNFTLLLEAAVVVVAAIENSLQGFCLTQRPGEVPKRVTER